MRCVCRVRACGCMGQGRGGRREGIHTHTHTCLLRQRGSLYKIVPAARPCPTCLPASTIAGMPALLLLVMVVVVGRLRLLLGKRKACVKQQ